MFPNSAYLDATAVTASSSSDATPNVTRSNSSNSLESASRIGEIHPSVALEELIHMEGGGSWPPKAQYAESWPLELQPYATVAMEAPFRFVLKRAILNTDRNIKRISENRLWMLERLQQLLVLDPETTLSVAIQLPLAARSGFLACLAYLNHLYRWGTLPVVSEAQTQTDLDIPQILSVPLRRLNQLYGIRTSGACLYTMTLCNVDMRTDQAIVYSNMAHLGGDEASAERYNAVLFYEIERRAYTFYRALAKAVELADDSQWLESANELKEGNQALAGIFRYFFSTLKQDIVNKEVWMSHAQGFHGWGLFGDEGVSGDQSLLIRTLDALLSIPLVTQSQQLRPMYASPKEASSPTQRTITSGALTRAYQWAWSWLVLSPNQTSITNSQNPGCPISRKVPEIEYSTNHLPTYSRQWIEAVRNAGLRKKAVGTPLEAELNETLRLFKMWRLGHIRKALYYEDLDLPERRPMTAGGGQGSQSTVTDMIAALRARLSARIAATR